ncbi:MAG TPA: hypothetical protein VM658_02050 [bacterium]|nr:hypothetical protein [bacterium]
MERVFIDPVIHSRRLERVQTMAFAAIMILLLAAVWIKWKLSGGGEAGLRLCLMMSSIVAAAFGLGYYMLKRTRRVMRDHVLFIITDSGVRSERPDGVVEAGWDEIEEVRIGIMPSRNKMPDVLIKTGKGYIPAFLRWTDRAGPLPEPAIRSAGRGFISPDGSEFLLTPENSPLLQALRERLPREKFREGVLITL